MLRSVHSDGAKFSMLVISKSTRAIIYMSLYAITQSVIWGVVRFLSEDLSVSTLFFFKNIIALITVLPLFLYKGKKLLYTQKAGTHALRALAAFAGGFSIFLAISLIPLATVVAITFTAPIIASGIAIWCFKETITKRKTSALIIGIIGAAIVLRPSFSDEWLGVISACIGALLTAAAFLLVNKLSDTDSHDTVVIFPLILVLPCCVLPAVINWTMPSIEHIPFLLVMGAGLSFSQYCMVKAFSLSEASSVLPYDYLRLILASVIGFVWFGDVIDEMTFMGGSLILLSAALVTTKSRSSDDKE